MKKIKNYILGFCAITLAIACSSSDDNGNNTTNSIKPSKYTVAEVGDTPYSLFFEYNGDLIKRVTTDFGNTITINYNSNNTINNYIVQNTGEPTETFTATYQNNLLTELKNNTNTERTLFYYDSNNRVNKTDYYESGFLTTEFYQYDGNGNVIQSNDNYSTFQYTYNTLNNPFKNVFPQIDAEVSWYWFGSLVNNQTIVKEKLSTSTTFTTKYTYTYETNSSNYPTKRIQRNLSGNITETVTYEY